MSEESWVAAATSSSRRRAVRFRFAPNFPGNFRALHHHDKCICETLVTMCFRQYAATSVVVVVGMNKRDHYMEVNNVVRAQMHARF